MVTALVQLHQALVGAELPFVLPGIEDVISRRREMIDQLEDYVIPRVMTLQSPLLAVVGGSTGAGKSTLVNSLVGHRVTTPGVLRPTTRSPVLVHHPDDATWFGQDRLLPDLTRVKHSTDDPSCLQLVSTTSVPQGLAILDAPDVDSVEERNRLLAAQLMQAADLWLFVTSAARYADQVPWAFLRQAAERSTAVAVILDRTPDEAIQTVSTHLARMLASRGLKDSPLFTVTEGKVDVDGLLPAAHVVEVRSWLESLAADTDARTVVVRQTLEGAVRTITRGSYPVADISDEQTDLALQLKDEAVAAYEAALETIATQSTDGTVVQGEVLVRWQEFIGTGELLSSLESRVGGIRDRLVNTIKGKPQQAERLTVAIEAGLETLLLEQAEVAAARSHARVGRAAGRLRGAEHRDPRPEPRLARPAPQGRADGARLAARPARDGARRRCRPTHQPQVPGLRRQRSLGGPDGRGAGPHVRHRPVGGVGPPAARGRVRRCHRDVPGRPRTGLAHRAGRRTDGRGTCPLCFAGRRTRAPPDRRRAAAAGGSARRRPALRGVGQGRRSGRLVVTSMLEDARQLVLRGSDLGTRIEGLEGAVAAGRGRLDDSLLDEVTETAGRGTGRLRLSAQHTVVAIAGATGSGKSSTFNALTGLELSSTGVRRPTTSWATACVWGSADAEELLEWLGIPPRHQTMRDSLLDLDGDTAYRADRELDGVVLMDLPDHDSTEVAHHLEVDRLVVLADLLVWVLDPQKYADAAIHDRYFAPLSTQAKS